MTDKNFSNPYKGCARTDEVFKLTARIPRYAFQRVAACRVEHGTIETIITTFWSKLIEELNERNISTVCDSPRLEHFIANMQLVLPGEQAKSCSTIEHHCADSGGSAVAGNDGQAAAPDDGRRATDTRRPVARSKGKHTDVEKRTPRRSGGGGGSGRGKKTQTGQA